MYLATIAWIPAIMTRAQVSLYKKINKHNEFWIGIKFANNQERVNNLISIINISNQLVDMDIGLNTFNIERRNYERVKKI